MKNRLLQAFKYIVFLALGLFIFWLVYRDMEMGQITRALKEVNYWWIALSLFIGILSHISRTVRWQMLIESLGKRPGTINSFMAVMIGYLANLAFPRLGEVSRCGVLTRYEKISFSRLVGTVVMERSLDMVMLLILLLIVIITQMSQVMEFLNNNPGVRENIMGLVNSTGLLVLGIGLLAGAAAAYFLFRDYLRQLAIYQKVKNIVLGLWEGIKSISNVKKMGWFIFHSIAIWGLYYLMMYITFFAFDFTAHYGPLVGLTVFVMASFGMVAPVQGGIGAWHFMAIATFYVYQLPNDQAKIFALVVHGTMTLLLLIVGLISLLVMPIYNRRREAVPLTEELKQVRLK